MSYGFGHRAPRPTRPRRPSDAVLVQRIVASLAQHPGRDISAYTQREVIVAQVRAALAKEGHPTQTGA